MATTTGHFANNYSFAISGIPGAHQDKAGLIERDAIAVINYLSEFVSWKGTLDFVVKFGQPDDFGAGGRGLLPSYGGIARDGRTVAGSEALTGQDANGSDWDAGCYILPNANGSLTNYDAPLYFDPNPDPNSSATLPPGSHDFFSIFLHEIVHGLGFWSNAQNGGSPTAFDQLTVQRDGQYFFTGANTHALLGQDLPFSTFGSRDHYGLNDSAPEASPINRGLMWQYGNYEANRFQLGQVDLAVLKDLGYTVANESRLAITEQPDSTPGVNDVFFATSDPETFDGAGGTDTVVYPGLRSDYTIMQVGSETVYVTGSASDQDQLTSIERIRFTDGDLIYDLDSQNAPAAYRLYGGAFDRTPDEPGLRFWTNQWLDTGKTLHDAAVGFIESREFVSRYGASQSNAQFVDALYMNVLHRAGEAAGVAFWNEYLSSSQGDRADVLVSFTQLPEYVGNSDANIVNGYWVFSTVGV